MASSRELLKDIQQGKWDRTLLRLYGADRLERQRQRYAEAVYQFQRYFGACPEVRLYSVPGRTELCGNHTDHQKGIGLAAAVDRDIIAVVARRDTSLVRVKSYGFDKLDIVDLQQEGRQQQENTHSASLIRGIGNALRQRGGCAGGFDAYTTSDVLRGSGLSSSAAFEVMMGIILNDLYNGMRFSPLELARVSQYAENCYFGKPCGLLDPLSCAMGSILCVDMEQEDAPQVQTLQRAEISQDLALCITDTRGSHSELTDEFAQVRSEMESVAQALGCENLRQTSERDLWRAMPRLRRLCGDRAVLRALHFYQESRRAQQAFEALRAGAVKRFLRCMTDSGHSAFQYNQNTACQIRQQAIPLALAVSQSVLGQRGACRLQGTGFAGTIQAFVPRDLLPEYIRRMELVFDTGCCDVMKIRQTGAERLL